MSKVSKEKNEAISAISREEEIIKALFSMKVDKAPGLDGFLPGFYQRYWQIQKDELIQAIQIFFSILKASKAHEPYVNFSNSKSCATHQSQVTKGC